MEERNKKILIREMVTLLVFTFPMIVVSIIVLFDHLVAPYEGSHVLALIGNASFVMLCLYPVYLTARFMMWFVKPEARCQIVKKINHITSKEFLIRAVLFLLVIYIALSIISDIKHHRCKKSARRSSLRLLR